MLIDKDGDQSRRCRQGRTQDRAPVELHAVWFPHGNKDRSLTYGCSRGRFSPAVLKRRLIEPARLYEFWNQMISFFVGNRVPRHLSRQGHFLFFTNGETRIRHPEARALASLEGWAAGTFVASILRGSPKMARTSG
jgi:hypothetical protein